MKGHRRAGFTLIELLIVIVIIGILAAIAIPKFQDAKERAYVASMKSDLRSLVSLQELYASNQNPTMYASDIASVKGFNPSKDVTVTVDAATGTSWKATATHSGTSVKCQIAVGDPGFTDGIPQCQ